MPSCPTNKSASGAVQTLTAEQRQILISLFDTKLRIISLTYARISVHTFKCYFKDKIEHTIPKYERSRSGCNSTFDTGSDRVHRGHATDYSIKYRTTATPNDFMRALDACPGYLKMPSLSVIAFSRPYVTNIYPGIYHDSPQFVQLID